MITKAQIQRIRSLHQGKFREEYSEFIAEGVKVADELLRSAFTPKMICAVNEWIQQNENILKSTPADIIEVNESELGRISALATPNKVLVVFQQEKPVDIPDFKKDELVLVLDEIKDPGNLGTIIRIADWFGIDQIVCSLQTVDVYNPKTIQSTMGSLARVNVHYTGLKTFLEKEREHHQVFATTLTGENIYHADLPKGGLILIGSESHGLSQTLQDLSHRQLTIPRFAHSSPGHGQAESLNASVAAAILCNEFRRK